MIVSKTPMRMSFAGGGSDISTFYKNGEGAVLSTSIDKYMYLVLNKKFDGAIRLSYSKTEEASSLAKIQHPLVRESLKLMGINKGIEIASLADIPSKGSGLGSSSAYTVGLLNALHAYKNLYVDREQLANLACKVEIDLCKEPIGKQDQYAASYGGLNLIRFYSDESVSVEPIICRSEIYENLQDWIIMFYTGITRSASAVLKTQYEELRKPIKQQLMEKIYRQAFELKREIELGDLNNIGLILNEGWNLKKQITASITNSKIDHWYQAAIKSGAIGGKLLGAGNGGFMIFFAHPRFHEKIKNSLPDLRQVNYRFDRSGSQIVHYQNNEI